MVSRRAPATCILPSNDSQAPRKPIRARAAAASKSSSTSKPTSSIAAPTTTSSHLSHSTTKEAKRDAKRSSLLSRLSASRSVSSRARPRSSLTGVSKSRASLKKRSRKPKALAGGTLSALADALPDDTDAKVAAHARAVSEVRRALQSGESLRSRTGVQKRREEVARVERERFKGNLSVMGGAGKGNTAGAGDGPGADANAATGGAAGGTWAALRAHIASGMTKETPVAATAGSMEEEVL
jgi:hypothetical protein